MSTNFFIHEMNSLLEQIANIRRVIFRLLPQEVESIEMTIFNLLLCLLDVRHNIISIMFHIHSFIH